MIHLGLMLSLCVTSLIHVGLHLDPLRDEHDQPWTVGYTYVYA